MAKPRPFTTVGRGEIVTRTRAGLAAGTSVLLLGPAGIGKSTLLSTISATIEDQLVLKASAAESESGLPYLTLVDLFGDVVDTGQVTLPGHLRAALDGALLRSAVPTTAQDELAVRLAFLELLRGLARRRPVLIVLDDIQWMDEPSAGVLRFIARRLDRLPVAILAAERVEPGALPRRTDLLPPSAAETVVPPLGESDLADLLSERTGAPLSRQTLTRIYSASGGNPLFAVELARALGQHPVPLSSADPLPVPDRLRRLLAARIAPLPPPAHRVLLIAAAAARATLPLLRRCVGTTEEAGSGGSDGGTPVGLAAAVGAGIVVVESDGGVRFAHPLLREMVYADASAEDRRTAHERLSGQVEDPVERAAHLAQARPEPDEELAATLAEAAGVARLRGASGTAADLAALAADRTPASEPTVAAARRLAAAEYAYSAGAPADAQRYATEALRDVTDPTISVQARLLLVDVAAQDQSGVGPLLDAALDSAGDDALLLAKVRLYRALKAYYDGDHQAVLSELKLAEAAAEQAEDAESLVDVLTLRGMMIGGVDGDELLDRAAQLSEGLPLTQTVVNSRQRAATARMYDGDCATAVARIEKLREAVERSGTMRDLAGVLRAVSEIYARAGRGADALAAGRYCLRLYADVELTPGPGLLAGAVAELYAGSVAQALDHAERAAAASLAAGDDDWLRGAYATAGMCELLRGDPVAALEPMRRAWALEQRSGRNDPVILLWHADFVEALAGAGERAEAAAVLAEARERAARLGRTVVQLGLDRAQAVLDAACGDPRGAADTLAHVIAQAKDHPYPMEVAHAWHTLGNLERRAHRRAAARVALTEAVQRYETIGAAPWLTAALADLARLDGGRGAGLSDTERRIVEMVRSGATNREIASSLFLSIKAVEANLTRLYRRLGVRNRAQLAQAFEADQNS